jgi:hypothetical protein
MEGRGKARLASNRTITVNRTMSSDFGLSQVSLDCQKAKIEFGFLSVAGTHEYERDILLVSL